jgi:2-(1,2-epoxy-1,2-dihydrophenyl)acetyl-CoA isomerase
MYETLELDRRGAAAIIRLNRPEALNAWNDQLGLELLDAVRSVAEDDAVRAVGVTGSGRAFSSGADLRDMAGRPLTAEGHIDVYTTLTTVYHPILTTLRRMPKPVVAALNGPAVGIGCSLALACDTIVCAESAYMLLGFVNIGLVPDGGALALISTRAGAGRAAAMALLGERVPAADLLRTGLVDEVAADGELGDRMDARLDAFAAGPTRSYAGSKRQINAWLYADLDEQLEREARIQQEMAGSADFREGVTAFLEKRAPTFAGG